MRIPRPTNLRTRLTLWYVIVLAVLLLVYAALVFAFQYAVLTRQLVHDEIQDVVTAEGLLYFDVNGSLQLNENYFSHPQSRLLIDRFMEVRDLSGNVLYRSSTLRGMPLGGRNLPGEGAGGFDERITRLQDGTPVYYARAINMPLPRARNKRQLPLKPRARSKIDVVDIGRHNKRLCTGGSLLPGFE